MERVIAQRKLSIPLGRAGENCVRQIIFPLNRFAHLGAGRAALAVTLPGDERQYPIPVKQEDGEAVWTVTAAETLRAGYGQAQLSYLIEDRVAKTEVYDTWVECSLDGASEPEPPAAQQGWVDQVLDAGTRAEDAARRAETAAEGVSDISQQVQEVRQSVEAADRHAGRAEQAAAQAEQQSAQVGQTIETKLAQLAADGRFKGEPGKTPHFDTVTAEALPAGAEPTVSLTGEIEHLVLSLGIPRGEDGQNGQDGQDGQGGGGGLEPMMVAFTDAPQKAKRPLQADQTFEAIEQALDGGRMVFGSLVKGGMVQLFQVTLKRQGFFIVFSLFPDGYGGTADRALQILLFSDDTAELKERPGAAGPTAAAELPAVVPPGLPAETAGNTQAVLNALAQRGEGGTAKPEKRYESIEKGTIGPEAAVFRRTACPDGTPYQFESVALYLEFPSAPTPCHITMENDWGQWQNSYYIKETDRYLTMHLMDQGGFLVRMNRSGSNKTNDRDPVTSGAGNIFMNGGKAVMCISSTDVLPANTVFEIKAVKIK